MYAYLILRANTRGGEYMHPQIFQFYLFFNLVFVACVCLLNGKGKRTSNFFPLKSLVVSILVELLLLADISMLFFFNIFYLNI